MFQATVEVPSSLWSRTGTTDYGAGGGRDVLILAPDLSLPHPEAVARRPGQLTKQDKLKLQRQGVPPDYQSELEIMKARYKLDKKKKVVRVESEKILQEKVMEFIARLLMTTHNDGGIV